MTYTYLPGARQDALSILRAKGLLDHPERPAHAPGKFLLDVHSHRVITEDGSTMKAPPRDARLRASIHSAASPNNGLAKGASADRCQQAPKVSS